MARSPECMEQYAQKELDTADIVRDTDFSPVSRNSGLPLVRRISRNGRIGLRVIQAVRRLLADGVRA
jgi:hypothetical protein